MKSATDHDHSVDAIRRRLSQKPRPGYLRDFIYGGVDGAVTTFAIVAGAAGAGISSSVVVVLGAANILADGFSMAAANYSGTKAERDNADRLREIEREHIRRVPDGEREEVRQILQAKGMRGKTLTRAVDAVTADEKTWVDLMLVEEYGISLVSAAPILAAISTFAAFLVCGLIPLVPFIFSFPNPSVATCLATGAVFVLIGAFKSRWTVTAWWKSGMETLSIGAAAALIAYLAGKVVGGAMT